MHLGVAGVHDIACPVDAYGTPLAASGTGESYDRDEALSLATGKAFKTLQELSGEVAPTNGSHAPVFNDQTESLS